MSEAPKGSVFLANLHYFYAQTDGTYRWPEGSVGDLLRQAKQEIEARKSVDESLTLDDDQQVLEKALDAFSVKHGVWKTTELLLVQLADRQRKEGKIKSADYTGDDFHITVKLKAR